MCGGRGVLAAELCSFHRTLQKFDLDSIELFKSSIRAISNFSKLRFRQYRTLAKFGHVGSAKVVVFSNTWTQPVLGQDFTALWLATLGRGINIMIPLPRERKPNSRKKKSRLHWLRPRLYLLTGLCTDRAMHTCSRSSVRGTLYYRVGHPF